jgi:hypothetical protein
MSQWPSSCSERDDTEKTRRRLGDSRNDPITHLTSRHALTHLDHLTSQVAPENRGMRHLEKVLGMHNPVGRHDSDDDVSRRRTRIGSLLDKYLVEWFHAHCREVDEVGWHYGGCLRVLRGQRSRRWGDSSLVNAQNSNICTVSFRHAATQAEDRWRSPTATRSPMRSFRGSRRARRPKHTRPTPVAAAVRYRLLLPRYERSTRRTGYLGYCAAAVARRMQRDSSPKNQELPRHCQPGDTWHVLHRNPDFSVSLKRSVCI